MEAIGQARRSPSAAAAGLRTGMASDPNAAAIVRALIGLGSGLSLSVTAEGVEDSDQRSTLITAGCVQAQGFLFGKAMPAEEIQRLLWRPRSAA